MLKIRLISLISLSFVILFESCNKEEAESGYQSLAPKNATQVQLKIFNDLLADNNHSGVLDTVKNLGTIAWEKASIMFSSEKRTPVHLILPIKNRQLTYNNIMDVSFSPERKLLSVRIIKEESVTSKGIVNKNKINDQRLFSQISGKDVRVSSDIVNTVKIANKDLYYYSQDGNLAKDKVAPNRASNSSVNCEIRLTWNAYITYNYAGYTDPYQVLMYDLYYHMNNYFNGLGIFHDLTYPSSFGSGELIVRENVTPNDLAGMLKNALLSSILTINGNSQYQMVLTGVQYFGYGNCSPQWGGGSSGGYFPSTSDPSAISAADEEGSFIDESEWTDFSQQYSSQPLPSWEQLYNSYPHQLHQDLPSPQVYSLVGGNVYSLYLSNPAKYNNACALRVSRALLYSGVTIPNKPGYTFKGGDNKYYFLSSAHLNTFMTKTFGTGTIISPNSFNSNYSNFRTVLGTQKAIYIMRPNYPGQFGAMGHATLYDGNDCFNTSGGHDGKYLNPTGGLDKIILWRVQ